MGTEFALLHSLPLTELAAPLDTTPGFTRYTRRV